MADNMGGGSQSALSERNRELRTKHNEQSVFFTLPPELLNEVYKWTLRSDTYINLRTMQAAVPALGHVCRTLRNETGALFFKHNRFKCAVTMNDLNYFWQWLDITHEHRQDAALVLYFRWLSPPFGSDAAAAKQNLKTLFNELYLRIPRDPDATMPGLLRVLLSFNETEIGRRLVPTRYTRYLQKLNHLLRMLEAYKMRKSEWKDVKVGLEHAINAAGICGEPDLG